MAKNQRFIVEINIWMYTFIHACVDMNIKIIKKVNLLRKIKIIENDTIKFQKSFCLFICFNSKTNEKTRMK